MKPDGRAECAPETASTALSSQVLPPFSPLRPETLATLLRLVRWGASAVRISLSDAIVVQLWFVFCGPEASTELAQAGRAGVYAALYALAVGGAPPPLSAAQLDRLRQVLHRKPQRGGQAPGLILKFQADRRVNKRFRSEVREPRSRSGDAGSTEHVSTGPEYEPNWLVCLCSSQGWH